MTPSPADSPTFGTCPPGVVCHDRPAAYAVILGPGGRVAAVRWKPAYWLPGGGCFPGESPEDTVTREVREELGRAIRLVGRIGDAVQFFFAGDEERWYRMRAVFFQAELEGEPVAVGEHELCWLDAHRDSALFFHACHAWAVARRRDCPPLAASRR